MILSLIFGLLRLPLWTPAALSIAWGILDQILFEPNRAAWRSEVGISDAPGGALMGFLFGLILNYAAFGAGYGARLLFERMRSQR